MAVKRKAVEAFGKGTKATRTNDRPVPQQESAFAAARRLAQTPIVAKNVQHEVDTQANGNVASTTEEHPTRRSGLNPSIDPDIVIARAPDTVAPDITNTSLAPFSSPSRHLRIRTNNEGYTEVDLNQDAFVTVLGEYQLEVVSGVVTIYGASFDSRSGLQQIQALTSHALPQIVARAPNTTIRLTSTVTAIGKLSQLSPLFKNLSVAEDHDQSFLVLHGRAAEKFPRSLSAISTSKQYQAALTQITMRAESSPRGLVLACIGGKSSGKSTFCRHACNKLLSRTSKTCYILDIDPGQPEFGPPGQVYLVEVKSALLGPPYTHLATRTHTDFRLVAAHTIAAKSFKDNPDLYMTCVRHLFESKELANARQQGVPLIINTAGWINDLGARIIVDVLQLGVTDAVLLDVTNPDIMQAAHRCQSHYELSRTAMKQSSRSPGDLRQMQTMAYFHTSQDSASPDTNGAPISEWRAWNIGYAGTEGGLRGVITYGPPPDIAYMEELLDGAIVALVTVGHDALSELIVTHTAEGLPCMDMPWTIPPACSKFEGLALIRAIDSSKQQIQLLTPLPDHEMAALSHKNVLLVRGTFDSPDWAYLEDLYKSPNQGVPQARPWIAPRERTGIEGGVWRLRHPPTVGRAI